jgi:hydrogenase nickel incorporation protein HypA/HybF
MHEISVAQSLIDLVEDELAARAAAEMRGGGDPVCQQVGQIVVRVGALSGVVPEALSSAFRIAVGESSIRGATLVIESCPVVVWCEPCGRDSAIASPQRMRCPACGRSAGSVVGGRELELTSIEVTDAAAHAPGPDADP